MEYGDDFDYDKELDRMLAEGNHDYYFLDKLFRNNNIEYVTKDPRTFFSKLIKLYGEDELTNYTYAIYDTDMDYEGRPYDYVLIMSTIHDWVSGHEDLLDLVTSNKLRDEILGDGISGNSSEIKKLEDEIEKLSETEGKKFLKLEI